jgi:YVTN family beta-propeller protein
MWQTKTTIPFLSLTPTYAVTNVIGFKQPFAIAATPDSKKVYVTNLRNNSVAIINATNQVTSFSIGRGPYGVAVTPDGTELYVIALKTTMSL